VKAPETVDQYSKDVGAFLMWVAEPHMNANKAAGFRVLTFLILFAVLMWLVKHRCGGRSSTDPTGTSDERASPAPFLLPAEHLFIAPPLARVALLTAFGEPAMSPIRTAAPSSASPSRSPGTRLSARGAFGAAVDHPKMREMAQEATLETAFRAGALARRIVRRD